MTTKAFRAALFINSSNVPTPLEWLVLGCIGVFASFTLIYFSVYLFQLLFPTTPFLGGAPLQQQTEFQLLFGCCQQQADRLVVMFSRGASVFVKSHFEARVFNMRDPDGHMTKA